VVLAPRTCPYPVAPVNSRVHIIVIIDVIVAYGVAAALRRALSLKYFEQYPDVKGLLGLSVGAVKAFIILVTLAIAFSVLKLGPATVYMQEIANYLPSLAGAIILLTLGVALINILVDYIQRQVGGPAARSWSPSSTYLSSASTP